MNCPPTNINTSKEVLRSASSRSDSSSSSISFSMSTSIPDSPRSPSCTRDNVETAGKTNRQSNFSPSNQDPDRENDSSFSTSCQFYAYSPTSLNQSNITSNNNNNNNSNIIRNMNETSSKFHTTNASLTSEHARKLRLYEKLFEMVGKQCSDEQRVSEMNAKIDRLLAVPSIKSHLRQLHDELLLHDESNTRTSTPASGHKCESGDEGLTRLEQTLATAALAAATCGNLKSANRPTSERQERRHAPSGDLVDSVIEEEDEEAETDNCNRDGKHASSTFTFNKVKTLSFNSLSNVAGSYQLPGSLRASVQRNRSGGSIMSGRHECSRLHQQTQPAVRVIYR